MTNAGAPARRILIWAGLALAVNAVWWAPLLPVWARVVAILAALAWYVWIHIAPRLVTDRTVPARLRHLVDGYELVLAATVVAALEVVAYLLAYLVRAVGGWLHAPGWVLALVNAIVAVVLLGLVCLNGVLRLLAASLQTSRTRKILLLALWWLPGVNLLLVRYVYRIAVKESRTEAAKAARDAARLPQQVCRTRYPLLLVHGIFFRDWPLVNYWGRIPAVLAANGATIHYGGQQSAVSVAAAGVELASTIERIIQQTGCGKVNIIAHSKGGLDARWAISQAGAAPYVASLTTISTPHRGCNMARVLLERIPGQATAKVAGAYEALFTKLGDISPDFLAGVTDLTDTECARLNAAMPDAPGVAYYSAGSRMASALASPFPLNLGYSIVYPLEGPNDGLVATTSMPWGTWLGLVEPSGREGLSHGDMVDLLRRDIGDFDVCEFYVGLVSRLREAGY